MLKYDFLILSLLSLLPGAIIYALREDLRPVIRVTMICSIPFGFTEFLFYPDYWEPKFLFDLASKIGFGIEDLIFICGQGAFSSTAFAFFSGSRLCHRDKQTTPGMVISRVGIVFSATFLLVFIVAMIGIHMIYGSFLIMVGMSFIIFLIRRDLFFPSLAGAVIAMIVYTALCLIFALLFPHAFRDVWHAEKFLNLFFLGIPLEEYMYGFGSGMAATMFYPFVFNRFYCKKESQ